jgi:hypothetical protein
MALFYISGEWILSGDNQTVTIKPEDQIVAKTMERRVETGEAKTGRIFFSLLGDRQNQLKSLQFSVEISCMDFTGKRVVGKFIPDPSPVIGVALYPSEKGTILPKPEAPLLSDGKKAN